MSVCLVKFSSVYYTVREVQTSRIGTPIYTTTAAQHVSNYRAFAEEFLPTNRIGKHRILDGYQDFLLDVRITAEDFFPGRVMEMVDNMMPETSWDDEDCISCEAGICSCMWDSIEVPTAPAEMEDLVIVNPWVDEDGHGRDIPCYCEGCMNDYDCDWM